MRRHSALLCLLLAAAGPAHAQTIRESLRGLFRLQNGSTECGADALLCISASSGISTAAAFSTGVNASAGALIDFVGSSVALAVSNIPSPSTSGGTSVLITEEGLPVLSSQNSKGPIFAEWALTVGKGRLLVGANVTQQQFTELRGTSTGNLSFRIAQADFSPEPLGSPSFEQTYLLVNTHFALDSRIITGFITYGLFSSVDLGITVPYIRNSFSGYTDATIIPPPGSTASPYNFGGPPEDPRLTDRAVVAPTEASGIGDISARLKWRLTGEQSNLALALFAETRLPTGEAEQFLGTGKLSAKGLGVASLRTDAGFTPHLNLGYIYRKRSEEIPLRNAVVFAVGADQRVSSFLTLAADLLGQMPTGKNQFTSGRVTIDTGPNTEPIVFESSNVPADDDNLLDASLGAKISLGPVTGVVNGILPLNKAGLRSDKVLTAGLEVRF